MTNREVLKAKIAQPVPEGTIDLVLIEQGVLPDNQFDPSLEDDRKGMDLAQAGLIFWFCTNRKSVKELDFQFTQHDIDDLLKIRRVLLNRWGVPDELDTDSPTIESVSDLW
ncbi:DUF6706 family protein [Sphingobacterium suaedae]|uniref:DUF6706 family protein n=1 Tax=Sphingobacterium suaedae TaxID=1686402 RepID=A0ABW5KJH8_9SPHI